ncbi:MAG: hypothetical protein KC766_21895 [Myxococcales bacterium]|nr:hypothetical protein [Myxococcales bacterium]
MSRRSLSCANDALVDEIAAEALSAGATALGACLAGFFAAAAKSDDVLFSPLSIILGGVGTGGRAFDGRLRQPGLGVKRPRGFISEAEVPIAARIAIPCGIAAAAVACAYQAGTSLSGALRPALQLAKKAGGARVDSLERVRQLGGNALRDPLFARPLQLLAGPSEGGVVSAEDLVPQQALDVALTTREASCGLLQEPPWVADPSTLPDAGDENVRVVLAVDVHGSFAALSFQRVSGPLLEGLDLRAPLGGLAVMRGVPRHKPGSALPAPAPIGLLLGENGAVKAVVAQPGAPRVDTPSIMLARDASTRRVERVK